MVNEITTAAGLGKSDHATIIINLTCSFRKGNGHVRNNYAKANFREMSSARQCKLGPEIQKSACGGDLDPDQD